MENAIVRIDPKEFGLEEKSVAEIESAFMPKIIERDGLAEIYGQIIKAELNNETCEKAGEVRKKLVKVRTGISNIHKTQKAFFLSAGRFVDAWKNKETEPIVQMEENLLAIEKHFENIEKERLAKIQAERLAEIAKYMTEEELQYAPNYLCNMSESAWVNYLEGAKVIFERKQDAIKQAELDAIEAEKKEAERLRLEAVEQKRIKDENERLKKAAEERERLAELERKANADRIKAIEAENKRIQLEKEAAAKLEADKLKAEQEKILAIEKEKAKKLQAELELKEEQERKEKEAEALRIQNELNKGDAAKVDDLLNDLEILKTKYSFKSAKNIKKMENVSVLIDKVINYIKQ